MVITTCVRSSHYHHSVCLCRVLSSTVVCFQSHDVNGRTTLHAQNISHMSHGVLLLGEFLCERRLDVPPSHHFCTLLMKILPAIELRKFFLLLLIIFLRI